VHKSFDNCLLRKRLCWTAGGTA